MAFNIYPDPQDTPLSLADGTGMAAPEALAAHEGMDPLAGNLPTAFIRISMSGAPSAAPPQVSLVAVNSTTLTEGAEVTITATSPGTAQGLLDGTNLTDAAAAYFFPPHADNVYLLKAVITIGGTTLKIRIHNDTGVARELVWVVADSAAEARQPWIHVTPTAHDFNVLINQDAALTTQDVSIENLGTGPLTVTGLSPALPASYAASGLPVTLGPNAADTVSFTYNAPSAPAEEAAAAFAFDGDASPVFGVGHNREISLSAKAQALEIALLLDDSGSMSWDPNGDEIPPAAGPSRWNELATAANLFLDLLAVFGRNNVAATSSGTFGVARFPTTDTTNPSTYDLVAPLDIPADMTPHQTAISGNAPFFAGTPMGDGIDRVLTPAAGYFSTDPTEVALNRRWLLLMSDGAHNSGTHHPSEFVEGTALPGDSLLDKNIAVYAVGYGVPGAAEVNQLLLDTIVGGAALGSQSVNVEVPPPGLSASEVAEAFKAAIKSGLVSASSPLDPAGTLTSEASEARHPVIITPYDTKVAFLVHWNTEDAERMGLQLMTPTCELITPQSAGPIDSGELGFNGASRYNIYRVEESYLRNAADSGNPRHGTWTMVVSSDQLGSPAAGGSESYRYDVIVESRLQMHLILDRETYYAGDPIGISATITLDGQPITGAAVTLSLTAPGQSVHNWLAGVRISQEEYESAQQQVLELTQGDANAVFIKGFAARLKGTEFDRSERHVTLPMTDPTNQGVYSATFEDTTTPDGYKLYVTAVGTTRDGVMFRREGGVQVRVGVRPEPAFSLLDIRYASILVDDGGQVLTADVRVTPRDRFGNVLLVDPAIDRTIHLTAKDGEFTNSLIANLDGSYSRSLRYAPDAVPVVGLEVGGETVVSQPTVRVTQVRYADTVVAFEAGAEGATGANRHTDPRAALGNLLDKGPDEIVSLGAYGSLAVGVAGHAVLAHGDDDVTVFVREDEDLRSYSVEARSPGIGAEWVPVGESSGITQSFGLGSAGLTEATAIRITDTSGRVRDAEFEPSATPGVSLCGVGFRKVGPVDGEGDICIRIRVLNPERQPLGGTVDVEFRPRQVGEMTKVSGADASGDIDVRGLQRMPIGLYKVTVIPADELRPRSQFVTIPASGFHTVEFIIRERG